MGLSEKYTEIFNSLLEDKQIEVIDFMKYLKVKQDKEDDEIINKVVSENKEAMEELAKWEDSQKKKFYNYTKT